MIADELTELRSGVVEDEMLGTEAMNLFLKHLLQKLFHSDMWDILGMCAVCCLHSRSEDLVRIKMTAGLV